MAPFVNKNVSSQQENERQIFRIYSAISLSSRLWHIAAYDFSLPSPSFSVYFCFSF